MSRFDILVVSSWSPEGEREYGRQWMETYKLNVRRWVVSDDELANDRDFCAFMDRHGTDPMKTGRGNRGGHEYRFNACKFAHKVFALTGVSAIPIKPPRYLVWIDGDTTFHAKPDDLWWAKVLPREGETASYLGRKDWDHSECGWLAFDLEEGGRGFLADLRALYTKDYLFALQQHHDSYAFDWLRREYEVMGYKFRNLSDGVPGNHVWPSTVLAEVCLHHKGPVAKAGLSDEKV